MYFTRRKKKKKGIARKNKIYNIFMSRTIKKPVYFVR